MSELRSARLEFSIAELRLPQLFFGVFQQRCWPSKSCVFTGASLTGNSSCTKKSRRTAWSQDAVEALSLSFLFSSNALYHSAAIVFPKQLRSTLRTFASPKPVTASRIDASNVAAASGSGMASGSKGWIMSLPSLHLLLASSSSRVSFGVFQVSSFMSLIQATTHWHSGAFAITPTYPGSLMNWKLK